MGPRPEYPRPALRRAEWQNLNGEWEFGAGAEPVFDRRIVVPFCPESELSGIGDLPGDVVWYRRRFDAPEAERLHLHFGAVDYRATVWVNDVEVARHEGGHSPFTAEVTAAARTGENVLVVRAEDPLSDKTIPRGKQHWTETPEGIFYTATTGVWQSVWLEPLPALHVTRLSLVPDLRAGAVDFEVDRGTDLVVTLDGEVVGRSSGQPRGRIRLERVEPWHPDSPRLYGLEARLGQDRVESYFGLRTVEARDGRFWLNDEPFIQRLVLDKGYFPGGLLTAASDDVLCFLVWSEMPSFYEFTPEAGRRLAAEWTEIVQRDRGRPSIVTWVVANESFGLDQVGVDERSRYTSNLYGLTQELDGTRPVVSNDGWEHSRSDLCTLHDYSP